MATKKKETKTKTKPSKTTRTTTKSANGTKKKITSKSSTKSKVGKIKEVKESSVSLVSLSDIPNTSKIEPGDFLNYKGLCETLKVPQKTGNAKMAQTKDWLRYFDYEKIGSKYLIHEIYETPLEKEYKYPANAIYIKYIEAILLSLLANTEDNMVKLTPMALYNRLGMTTYDYNTISKVDPDFRVDEFSMICARKGNLDDINELEITSDEIDHFLDRCRSKFSRTVKNALTSLQRRMLIKYSDEYEYQVYEYNEFNRRELKTYIADRDDIEYILKVKRETLLEYGCEDEVQIFLKKLTNPYYKAVNDRVRRERGWIGLYKVYVIHYSRETSMQALQMDQDTLMQKYGLNKALIKFIDEQAEKNYGNNADRYPIDYIETQHTLSKNLLSLEESNR